MQDLFSWKLLLPVIELEARPPVGGTEQSLNSTGQVNKQIAHEEKPEQKHRRKGSLKRERNLVKCITFARKATETESKWDR